MNFLNTTQIIHIMRKPTKITNIVITTQVTNFINLDHIATIWKYLGVQYNSKKFPDLVWRIMKPKCTILMFRSGKIVAEGCQYTEEGVYVLRMMARLLRQEGYFNARCSHMIIQNVVGNGFYDFNVNLQKLAETKGEYCIVRKNFPGGIMKALPELLGTTALIFWTGAILVTGGSSTRQVREVVGNVQDIIIDTGCVMLPGETKESILMAAGPSAVHDISSSAKSREKMMRRMNKTKNDSPSSGKRKIPLRKDVKTKRKRIDSNNIVFE